MSAAGASAAPAPDGRGAFIAVVGPSGAGKDSLIAGARERLAADPRVVFARRVITRAPDATEPSDPVTMDEFRRKADRGEFALHWEANGLGYGLPAALISEVASGRLVVANVSRAVAPEVRLRFPRSLIVHVSATRETLAARLAARGRENPAEREARLARAVEKDRNVEADVRIENDGPLAESVGRFLDVIAALRRT